MAGTTLNDEEKAALVGALQRFVRMTGELDYKSHCTYCNDDVSRYWYEAQELLCHHRCSHLDKLVAFCMRLERRCWNHHCVHCAVKDVEHPADYLRRLRLAYVPADAHVLYKRLVYRRHDDE